MRSAIGGRYKAVDEIPYSENLPSAAIAPIKCEERQVLHLNKKINYNPRIKEAYINKIVTSMCPPGDDGNYQKSCVEDVRLLQLISRRVHFGKFCVKGECALSGYGGIRPHLTS